MFISLKRIIRFGWQGFSRNKGLASQAIFIFVIALLTATALIFFMDMSSFFIEEAQKRVDVSVYSKKDIAEQEILSVKEELYKISDEIKSIEYISQDAALESFTIRHQNDPLYIEALNEVGENPFLASLSIKADNSIQYAKISNFLQEGPFSGSIEKLSYYENKKVIDRLFELTAKIKTTGLFIISVLALFAILISFSNIKLTILTQKDEIATMRLVGAPNWFIRAPFLVQVIIYGLFALVFTNLIFFIILYMLNPILKTWLSDFSVLEYIQTKVLFILFVQSCFVFSLGIVSSLFATRKHLKV